MRDQDGMRITLEPTGKRQSVDGVSCRLWEGETDKGVAVKAWVAVVSPQTTDEAALADFDRELHAVKIERELVQFDMRMVL